MREGRPHPEHHVPEHIASREHESRVRRYEYRGADGVLMGYAVAEFVGPVAEGDLPASVRKFKRERAITTASTELTSLRFESDGVSVSLHDLVGDLSRLFVVTSGFRSIERDAVHIPEPQTPLDLLTLLHELGHVHQRSDSRFPLHVNDSPVRMGAHDYDALVRIADEYAVHPEETRAYLHEMQRVSGRLNDIADLQQWAVVNAELEALYDAHQEEFQSLVDTQQWLRERDATRRALVWLRALKRRGVDFTGGVTLPQKDMRTLRGVRSRLGSAMAPVLQRLCEEGRASVIEYGNIPLTSHPKRDVALKRQRRVRRTV